jgi:hypothetical protein
MFLRSLLAYLMSGIIFMLVLFSHAHTHEKVALFESSAFGAESVFEIHHASPIQDLEDCHLSHFGHGCQCILIEDQVSPYTVVPSISSYNVFLFEYRSLDYETSKKPPRV